MKEMVKLPHMCEANTIQATLAMHKESHVISKLKPKIRIIHIFTPEIIKTDVDNFRELVQRLTGKPGHQSNQNGCDEKKPKSAIKEKSNDAFRNHQAKMVQLQERFPSSSGYRGRVKEEEELWRSENPCGFLDGLGDFEGLVHGFSEFPILAYTSSNMDVFGETHLPL